MKTCAQPHIAAIIEKKNNLSEYKHLWMYVTAVSVFQNSFLFLFEFEVASNQIVDEN